MIQMIAGVYGLPVKQENGNIKIVGMGPKSGPFSIDPEREAELVAKKIARYVEQPVEETTTDPIGFDETPPEKSLEDMTGKELREVGAEYGLSFKGNAKKVDMIAAIRTAMETVEQPVEDAPTFDAAEAVQ